MENISYYSIDVIYSSSLRHRLENASGLNACNRVRLCLESPLECHGAIWMSIEVVARSDILERRSKSASDDDLSWQILVNIVPIYSITDNRGSEHVA